MAMSTYFNHPFMASLPGDPNCANGLGANYGPRFDHQVSSPNLYCSPPGHISQYGQSGSPVLHPLADARALQNNISAHPDLNGFDTGAGHISPPGQHGSWGMPGPQPSPTSEFPHGPGGLACVSEPFNTVSSPNGLSHSCGSPGAGQGIPFYPWMGVVGKYCLLPIPYLLNMFS